MLNCFVDSKNKVAYDTVKLYDPLYAVIAHLPVGTALKQVLSG